MMKHLFDAKDVSQTIKYWVYTTDPLNTMLWGAESWNISQANINKLNAFHHSPIRQIPGIRMKRVQEEKNMNEEVRRRFRNIPPVEAFITRKKWRYISKTVRDNQTSIPSNKLLGAWIHQPRKAGPQNSNRLSKKGLFCKWIGLAKDEEWWNNKINGFFDETGSKMKRMKKWKKESNRKKETTQKKLTPMSADEKTKK